MKTCRIHNTWPTLAAVALLCTAGSAMAEQLTTSGLAGSANKPLDGASCGGLSFTQNTDPNTVVAGTVECAQGGGAVSVENSFARLYPSMPATVITCVDFAIEANNGGAWPVTVRLWDNGAGTVPNTATMTQLGPAVNVVIPSPSALTFHTATFPAGGVAIPAGTNLVVELFIACRATASSATCPPGGDGGAIFIGSNAAGQSAPSYLKAPGCGVNNYVTYASINFPNVHIIQQLGAGASPCELPLPPLCPEDSSGGPGGTPDGNVGVPDLLRVISQWGQNGNPNGPRPASDCRPLPNGDCLVGVPDLLGVIGKWGPCPQDIRACCFANGSCSNLNEADCATQGGVWQTIGSTCAQTICPVVPDNDNCQGAIALNGVGDHTVNNAGATLSSQPGPTCTFGGAINFTRDVWYTHTATCSGNLTLSMCASTGPLTDSVLAVYTGTCPDTLTQVACNDDCDAAATPPNLKSTVTFTVTQGTTYLIRIGSWGTDAGNQGAATLNIACVPFNNDFCAEATQVSSLPYTDNNTLFGATQDTGVPNCGGFSMSKGRWYRVIGNGNTLTASLCATDPNFELNQFNDVKVSVFCGAACGSLFCVSAGQNNCSNPFYGTTSWCSNAGQQYWVVVHSPDTPGAGETFGYRLDITSGASCNNPLPCGPPNDGCSGATVVTSNINGADVVGNNLSATPAVGPDAELPAGSPTCHWNGAPGTVHNTLWYRFVAPATNVRIETCANLGTGGPVSGLNDSTIALYSGSCGSLVEVGCGEDDCPVAGDPPYMSRIEATGLTVGNTYYLMIGNPGGWAGSRPGDFTIKLETFTPPPPPANDDCAGAIAVVDGNNAVSNVNATTGASPVGGLCGGDATNFKKDVWYKYTATLTGSQQFSLCGSTGDWLMSIMTSTGGNGTCPPVAEIGCDDDFCAAGGPSQVTANVTAGQVYFIRLGSWGATADAGLTQTGTLVIGVGTPPPANDACSGATTINVPFSEVVTVSNYSTAASDPDTTCEIAGGGPFTKVGGWWYKWTPTAGQTSVTIQTCNSAGDEDSVVSIYSGACGTGPTTGWTQVACDDDACAVPGPFGRARILNAPVTPGTQYLIFIDNYSGGGTGTGGAFGPVTVNVSVP